MKKLPSKLKDEELLNALNSEAPEPTQDKPHEHSVLQFLADSGIYPGTELVDRTLLYKLYRQNCEEPVHNTEFYFILENYVKSVPKGIKVYYKVNKNSFDLVKNYSDFVAKKRYNKKVKNINYRKHYEQFLSEMGVSRGNCNIPAGALYFFYDGWQYSKKVKTRLNFKNFSAITRVYFETKKTIWIRCVVKVSKEFIDKIGPERLQTAKEWAKKFNGQTENGKKEKRNKKIKS